jgi:hypothetical protein
MIEPLHDPWHELRRAFLPLAGTAVVAVLLMTMLDRLL